MLNPTIKFLRKLWIDRGYTKEQAQAIAERDYKTSILWGLIPVPFYTAP